MTRFDAHISTATAIVHDTSLPRVAPQFVWIPTTLAAPEDEEESLHISTPSPSTCNTMSLDFNNDPDSEESLFVDLLLDEDEPDERVEEFTGNSMALDITIIWSLPGTVYEHCDLLERLRFQTFSEFAPSTFQRVFYHTNGARFFFDKRELDIMASPHALLNDICINGIAALLHHRFSLSSDPSSHYSKQCALFSTFDLPMVRYNATDSEIWRRTSKMEYWKKTSWILPIHRSRPALHWVLCCISPHTRELFLFDSFAEHHPWKQETKVRRPDLIQTAKPQITSGNHATY